MLNEDPKIKTNYETDSSVFETEKLPCLWVESFRDYLLTINCKTLKFMVIVGSTMELKWLITLMAQLCNYKLCSHSFKLQKKTIIL